MNIWIAALLVATAPPEDSPLDSPPIDWLTANSPHGFDITADGKVWVNANPVGMRDDYAILATDLHKVRTNNSTKPRVWIRGYHRRNPKVTYRETKLLVSIDCARDTLWIERVLRYDAGGELAWSGGPFASEPIVPGSIGESWRDASCPTASG